MIHPVSPEEVVDSDPVVFGCICLERLSHTHPEAVDCLLETCGTGVGVARHCRRAFAALVCLQFYQL